VLASVHEHTELVVDSFRNVQPMKLGMHSQKATNKFQGVTDNTCRSVQHSLQSVCGSLRRHGENRIAVVYSVILSPFLGRVTSSVTCP